MSGEWNVAPEHAWERKPIDGITVSGGLRGVYFQWEELQRGEQLIRQIAGELQRVVSTVGTASGMLVPLIQPAAHTGRVAQTAAEDAWLSLARCSADLEASAHSIAAARRRYDVTEILVLGGFETYASGASNFDALLLNAGRPTRKDMESITQLLGPAIGTFIGAQQREGNLRPAPVSATEVSSGNIVQVAPNLEWLLQRSRGIDAAGSGLLEVLEVNNGTGQRPSFIVSFPGTQPGGLEATGNPFDETGLAESMTAQSRYITQAVGDALLESGAQPGDPVILSGYSQGGIHAANAAGSESVGGVYDVRMVLTAGSPVGDIDVPATVQAVHLEHVQDWVPASDGTANPDVLNRVTVNLHERVRSDDGEIGLGPGHDIDTYLAGARKADASGDSALLAVSAVMGSAVLGNKGRSHVFHLRREARPKRHKAPVRVQPGPKF